MDEVVDLRQYVEEQRIATMVQLAAIPTGKADKVELKLPVELVVRLGLEHLQEDRPEHLEMVGKLAFGKLLPVAVAVVVITVAAVAEMMGAAQVLMVAAVAVLVPHLFLLAVLV